LPVPDCAAAAETSPALAAAETALVMTDRRESAASFAPLHCFVLMASSKQLSGSTCYTRSRAGATAGEGTAKTPDDDSN
jgi:hypothetical protein